MLIRTLFLEKEICLIRLNSDLESFIDKNDTNLIALASSFGFMARPPIVQS